MISAGAAIITTRSHCRPSCIARVHIIAPIECPTSA